MDYKDRRLEVVKMICIQEIMVACARELTVGDIDSFWCFLLDVESLDFGDWTDIQKRGEHGKEDSNFMN